MRAGWLDFKLGYRMLVKYPGLAIVGGLAIAVSIAIAAVAFEFATDMTNPTLPLDEGDRIVSIQNWDRATGAPQHRTLHDFEIWRRELTSIQEIGAYLTTERNLLTVDGQSEPIEAAEISTSAFRLARVSPLIGRPLLSDDEQAGAPTVAVIGYGIWQSRFGGDPAVVGRAVQLGTDKVTVVGVMPQGFAFPLSHRLWLPLRANASAYPPLQGPSIRVFGRLAPDASIERAQAEVSALGARLARDYPETNAQLQPRVVPYARSFVSREAVWQMYLMQSVFVVLLIVACANVATLIYARTATREGEIVLRTALGASRSRIVGQLFIEALVLASIAAVAGVIVADIALAAMMDVFWSVQEMAPPFWWNNELSAATLFYVVGLTVFGAAIAGVLPALKGTRVQLQSSLQQLATGGSRLRFGGIWTVVIVTQVALSVAFLPTALSEGLDSVRLNAHGDVAAEQFLSVRLDADAGAAPSTFDDLKQRVETHAGVLAASFADRLPGMEHPRREIEIEDAGRGRVRVASVDLDFFDTFAAPIVAGRAFVAGDSAADQAVVIVNQSFARNLLGGRNPVGRRIRYVASSGEPSANHEIVGVVKDLGMNSLDEGAAAGLYHVIRPERLSSVRLAVRTQGPPTAFAADLRAIITRVDPMLRIHDLVPLDEVRRAEQIGARMAAIVLAVVAGIALLLSTVGVYALMSFTVAQRTREIGIRLALGADARHVVAAIFSRAATQLALGIAVGAAVAVLFTVVEPDEQMAQQGPTLLLLVGGVMMFVGLCSCVGPAVRGLKIQPTEALRQRP